MYCMWPIQVEQGLVNEGPNRVIVEISVGVRTEHAQGAREIDKPIAEETAFDGMWVAEQIKVRIRFPSFAGEAFAALLSGYRRIGAGVGIGEDGIVGLVHGDGAGAGDRRRWRDGA